MDGPDDFASTTTALLTALTSSARAVENLSGKPSAEALWRQDPRIVRMAGELTDLLENLEQDVARGWVGREDFLRSLRSAKARFRRLRDLMADQVVATTTVPDFPPSD
jgi:hypothetical protein